MVRVAGDLCVVLQHVNNDDKVPRRQVYNEVVVIKINWGLINWSIEELDKLEAIVRLMFRIIIDYRIPIPFMNPIQKDVAISMNITK